MRCPVRYPPPSPRLRAAFAAPRLRGAAPRRRPFTHLRHLVQRPINAAAYCKARMRLPLAVLQQLLEHSAAAIAGLEGPRLWCGLRTYLVDATCALVPDTPDNQKRFPQPHGQKQGCGFPVPKLLGLFDAYSGLIVRVVFSPLYTHDLRGMPGLHPRLGLGDLLVGDRAFCSYAHFALLSARAVLAVFRIHASRSVRFRSPRRQRRQSRRRRVGPSHAPGVRRLGRGDQWVRWTKPRACYCPKWLPLRQYLALPEELLIREVRWSLVARGQRTRVVTLATFSPHSRKICRAPAGASGRMLASAGRQFRILASLTGTHL